MSIRRNTPYRLFHTGQPAQKECLVTKFWQPLSFVLKFLEEVFAYPARAETRFRRMAKVDHRCCSNKHDVQQTGQYRF